MIYPKEFNHNEPSDLDLWFDHTKHTKKSVNSMQKFVMFVSNRANLSGMIPEIKA
jgi:hypothetical protein